MIVEKTAKYLPAQAGKIFAVKAESGRNNRVIIQLPLEAGTDVRYIQELSGHKSSKTTEIYTYVSKASLTKIKNPLDNIMEKET